MDYKKILLYIAVALVGVYLYNAWMHEFPAGTSTPSSSSTTQQSNQHPTNPQSFAPTTYAPQKGAASNVQTAKSAVSIGNTVSVKTDVLAIKIGLNGGDIVSSQLLKYPVSIKDKNNFVQLQSAEPNKLYLSQSGITNTTVGKKTVPVVFTAAQTRYKMQAGQNKIRVKLIGRTANGLAVSKTYTFLRDRYLINVKQTIKNNSGKVWAGSYYQQMTRRNYKIKQAAHLRSYTGASYSTPSIPYEKLKFKTISSDGFSKNISGGWIALQQPYFLSAWIPSKKESLRYYAHVSNPTESDTNRLVYTVGYVSPQVTLQPAAEASHSAQFFVGPEVTARLKLAAPGLKYTIDYGWLAPISMFLFWVMMQIDLVINNWGWTIILMTLLIKVVLYYPSAISYRSMARMKAVAPRLKALKERYGDDKKALSRATMEIYKSENVNPMGGCLPMLIQVPIFIALYYVLMESVQFRQAPFIFWIHDLAIKDPSYILPILMGGSMFLQQKLQPAPPDPTQAKIMMFMPIIFTVVFLSFPAGLVIYWLTNNCVSILQQWYIMKTFDLKADNKKRKNKKKRKR